MAISEKQIEDVFTTFHEQLLGKGFKFTGRQVKLDNGLRVDLVFTDQQKKIVILEIKKDAITREDVGQTLQYAGMIENSRVILAAPIFSSSIKKAFDHYGIEYIEFDIQLIEKLLKGISNKSVKKEEIQKITIPKRIISEPLSTKTKPDGNIAFKVTFTDKNWSGVCSDRVYNYNINKRVWCGIQSQFKTNCRSKIYKNMDDPKLDSIPCYDAIALKNLFFSPGINHGPVKTDTPRRCLNAKVRKLAIFTSLEPGEPENERFIFAIGQIKVIKATNAITSQEETFYCDQGTAIKFSKDNYPKFWNYYFNANSPDHIAWGTGLFRYITDKIARSCLNDIIISEKTPKAMKKKADVLLKCVTE